MNRDIRKYYVRSGELERLVMAHNPIEAACYALSLAKGETIDKHFFYVDERGLRGPSGMNKCVDIEFLPKHTIEMKDVVEIVSDDDIIRSANDLLDTKPNYYDVEPEYLDDYFEEYGEDEE